MNLHTYLLFIGAVVVLVAIPGPDMAYMLGRTIAHGRKAGAVAAIGINAGGYAHVLAAVCGLSAILATSSVAFTVVKWCGACYLIWIGVQTLRARATAMSVDAKPTFAPSYKRIFWEGFLSDALNPKVAIFFLAFLPQFVATGSALSATTQLLILGVTSNVVAISLNLVIVMCASAATNALRRKTNWVTWLNRTAGVVFIGLGIRLAREKT